MNLHFTAHTRERMDERGIPETQVREAIEHPDKVGRSFLNRSRFVVKRIYYNALLARKHLLMVIYEEGNEEIRVITIIDTSKIEKYY